jgi:hypothetical protein
MAMIVCCQWELGGVLSGRGRIFLCRMAARFLGFLSVVAVELGKFQVSFVRRQLQ